MKKSERIIQKLGDRIIEYDNYAKNAMEKGDIDQCKKWIDRKVILKGFLDLLKEEGLA